VILRNGAVTATVPGNQDHFNDAGLAPATTYNFQIIAYRGSTRSQPSLDLRAATQTPQLSQAVFNSSFSVTENLEAGGDLVTGDKDGDTWYEDWTFTGNCAVGPCVTQLSGAVDGQAFTAVLKARGDGTYEGTAPINDYYYCGNSESNHTHSVLDITLKPVAAQAEGMQWQSTKLSGTVTWTIDDNPNGNCGGGTLVIGISG